MTSIGQVIRGGGSHGTRREDTVPVFLALAALPAMALLLMAAQRLEGSLDARRDRSEV